MFLIVCCLTVILWLFFVYFYPQFYICELVISFLPYIIFFLLIAFGVLVLLFSKKQWKYKKTYLIIAILYLICFFFYALKFNKFYTGEWFTNTDKWSTWLNILYSNILYKTKNYDELEKRIFDNDADMVLMVEFTDDFWQNMWDKLYEKYPYSARVQYSDKYYGNVVFSKYPIKNLTQDIERWTRRYSYFSINYNNINYYIYLVHTAAPVSPTYFKMRNNQLTKLAEDFQTNINKYSENDRILILWDFNLSPWSIYYSQLEKWLNGMHDLTKNYTILFTWAYKNLPLISSHIDHIFINEWANIDFIEKVDTPKSDHDWFFIKNFK